MKRPYVLCIMDGWGLGPANEDNSIAQASLPTWSDLWNRFSHSTLEASGLAVGLPEGQMGNSEVGHMTLGAGKPLLQELPRIDLALKNPETFENPYVQKALHSKGAVHFIGLLSDGGVHSHLSHLHAYADFFQRRGKKIWLHAFLDGRDCPPKSALSYIKQISNIPFATIAGRFYGMDRDHRWERTQAAYSALMTGSASQTFSSCERYVATCYENSLSDEFIPPAVHETYTGIEAQDTLFFFNFRSDRVRQLLQACVDPNFSAFPQAPKVFDDVIGMTDYGDALRPFYHVLYPPVKAKDTLGSLIANQGLHQLRLAETEKYAHVTFFFNGGQEAPFPNESRVLIPSPKVATYDLCPAMSAQAVTEAAIKALDQGTIDFIVMNYANPDMVGHTGHMPATIQALESLDACLHDLVAAVQKKQGVLMLTADHGNCEKMRDDQGGPHTAHTLNPVPFLLVDTSGKSYKLKKHGSLADVAPTILDIMHLDVPPEMTGKSLIETVS